MSFQSCPECKVYHPTRTNKCEVCGFGGRLRVYSVGTVWIAKIGSIVVQADSYDEAWKSLRNAVKKLRALK